MDSEKKLTLTYLRDMFNGTFDEDIIESVLEQRHWNTDRALDDLMVMTQGCSFEIPMEDFSETAPSSKPDPTSTNLVSDYMLQNGEDGGNASDDKAESEDEIIVVDEEEFCLTGESESDDAKSAPKALNIEPASPPKPSYANIARKNPPVYPQISQIQPPAILYQGYTSFERVKRTRDSIERVKLFVRGRSKIMVILRGCAGSGKTTLAKGILTSCGLKTKNPYWYIHSADNYFHLNDLGTYQYDASKLFAAHKWNQKNVLCVVREGLTPVIIDNTNTKMWEMKVYAEMAVCAGYEIEVIEPDTPWAFQISQLVKRNIHVKSVDGIRNMLQRYEYNISSSLLLKSFQLEYSSENIPPQTGTCELTDESLISLFEDLYNAIHVFPKQLKKLRKQQRPSRKARRKQREMEEQQLDEIVQAIENCGEQEANDSTIQDEIDLDSEIVKSFVKTKLTSDDTETTSDSSWEDVSNDSCASGAEEEDEEEDDDENEEESAGNSGDESDDAENDSDESDSSVSSRTSAEIPENNSDQGETVRSNPTDEQFEAKNSDLKDVNSMIDSFKNPVDLDEDELSVEVNFANKNKFSNRLYDMLSKSTPRLKCFENFHDFDGMDDLDGDPIADVSDPALIQSVTKLIEEDSEPKVQPLDDSCWKNVPDSGSESSTSIVKNILNNALKPLDSISSNHSSEQLPSVPDLPSLITPDEFKPDEVANISILNETGLNDLEDRLSTVLNSVDSNRTSVESFHDAQESLNSSFASPEVTVIYNEPDKLNDTKSNKSLKNINAAAAGNSTSCAEDDRTSLLNEAKKLTGSVESDNSLSYRNNLNDGDDSVTENYTDQVISSSKFKSVGDEMSSSNAILRNVIENDLWGDGFEDNTNIVGTDRNRCPSENSDENSDYGSNSSSSDELRITDIHNSVNRFVNNDINRDAATGEKKKQNVNVVLKNKNTTVTVTDDSNDGHPTWNIDSTVELNTLKERILVNSLDKVFGQKVPAAGIENQEAEEGDLQPLNVSRKSSSCGAVFQLIDNKLNDKSDKNVDRDEDFAPSTSRDDQESESSTFWNQWMKGDSWDTKESAETKDSASKITDPKPPRTKNTSTDSPSKQKNTDVSHSIRLVNDIKNADKNKILGQKLKNFEPIVTDYFKFRSYPNAEDSMFGLPAAYDGKFRNILHDSSKDTSYYGINTMPKKINEDNSDPDDKIKSSFSWSQTDDSSDNDSKRDQTFKNDPSDPEQSKLTRTPKKLESKTSPGSVDDVVSRWKSSLEETPPDYDKVFKWSPIKDVVDLGDWNTEDNKYPVKISNCAKPQSVSDQSKVNYFPIDEVVVSKRDEATNTGTDDIIDGGQYRVGRCREINMNRESLEVSAIELKMRCDKSTMTEGSCYTVKVKPIREDLCNMFPQEMADSILDLYEKCNGNMDWIIEILMEDGYSPTDDQLEYLSSLQNVANYHIPMESAAIEKDKPANEKRKNKSNGNGNKNNRRNNTCFEEKDPVDSPKKVKKKKIDSQPANFDLEEYHTEEAPFSVEATDEDANEGSVDLFLDATMVQQLIGCFGNPTVYSLNDCQPVIKLPVSLARQIHACLLESVIDQAEKNEFLINQLAEDELITEDPQNFETSSEVTQNDMIEVENSLSDVINSQFVISPNNEDSFASKLSLDLLLKSFPSLDPSFVITTFKSNNCNYYDTKKILNQMTPEVETNLTFNLNDEERLVDRIQTRNDAPLFDSATTSLARNEVLEQVNSYREDAAFNYEQWQKFNEKLKTTLQRKRFGVAPYYRELMSAFKQKYDEANANAAAVLINSCCKNSNVIDLHFFKVIEALRALDIFLDHHITRLISTGRPKATLYIITGRGAGNQGGVSQLQPPIKSRLKKRNIEFEIQPYNTGLLIAVVRKSSPLTNDL